MKAFIIGTALAFCLAACGPSAEKPVREKNEVGQHHETTGDIVVDFASDEDQIHLVSHFEIPPKPEKPYKTFLAAVEAKKQQYEARPVADATEKAAKLSAARDYLEKTMTEKVFEYWYGTPWDFNGHTRTPRDGEIACGYFITHTIGDIGFKIPRYKWAQQVSSVYIKALCKNPKSFGGANNDEIRDFLLEHGDGLYVVGLDNHVGYLWARGEDVRFVHSNYYQSQIGVMWENIDDECAFKHSTTHLIGKLFSDKMVENWLDGRAYVFPGS